MASAATLTAAGLAVILTPILLLTAAVTALTPAPTSTHAAPTPGTTNPDDPPAPGDPTAPDDRAGPRIPVGPPDPAGAGAVADIPSDYQRLYRAAAATCPMDWTILAAVGKIESDHGRSTLPGVRSGVNVAGAQGPLQFLPATFAAYSKNLPPGGAHPPSPYNPHDAVHAAAAFLCATGARNNRDLRSALWAYNHSRSYADAVLAQARRYRDATPPAPRPDRTHPPTSAPAPTRPPPPGPTSPPPSNPSTPTPNPAATAALAFARRQIGQPYRWAGNGPGGFDCSGLTRAAYAAARIALPRTAQTQYNAGPRLPAATTPQPGDLIFFGTSPQKITHVGIAVSTTHMINAPYTGALVRTDPIPRTNLIGITRPATPRS